MRVVRLLPVLLLAAAPVLGLPFGLPGERTLPEDASSRTTAVTGHRDFAARPTECPVTDDISARLLRLPFFTHIDDAEIERVVETLIDVLDR